MKKIDLMIDEFMMYCESKNLSKKPMMSYEQTLRLFSKYLGKELRIFDVMQITERLIRDYINNYIRNIKVFFNFLKEQNYIKKM